MFRDLGLFIAFILLIVFLSISYDHPEWKLWYDLSLLPVGFVLSSIWTKREDIILRIRTTLRGNETLRCSFSYLIKISVKDQHGLDRHLLVYNSKIGGFQPPGGVYKYYDDFVLKQLGASDHDKMHQKNDLRLTIPSRKYADLFKWFKTRMGRESGQEREFYEELIETGVLPQKLFSYGEFKFLRSFRTPIKRSEHFDNILEMKYFEVYDLILNKAQTEYLLKQLDKKSDLIQFASTEEINKKGYSSSTNKDEFRVLEHTTLLIKNDFK